ncbi:MAG: protein-glutamate O-methyltransferase CheR [Actinobacteria bacterium]|nr:protein-glutamate O-methyltransferase CheR [Actinomycetota bacterium]
MPEEPIDNVYRGNLARLLEKVRDERGLDLKQYRTRYVERRVAVRLSAVGVRTYQQYAAYLDKHPGEYAKLLDALTINVTQFFRDPTVYEVFRRDVIPALLETKRARHQRIVRLWSAGCATGEEPYSLAMSMLDGIARTRSDASLLTVIGTDIDTTALAVAKRGEYPVRELQHIPSFDQRRYVDTAGEVFRLKPEVMRVCRFRYLNLFESPPIHGIDIVFCRNVFIYFNREDQERMVGAFWEALTRGGYLVLGRSERLAPAIARRFEIVSSRERIFRKPPKLL